MNKKLRMQVYEKYNGHCSYCGKEIEIKEMQVDHIIPRRNGVDCLIDEIDINNIENLNPSCMRCNHYKRANSLETFRRMLKTLQERVRKIYICKVAEDYGIIKIEPWDGKFYFEKVEVTDE